MANNQYVNKVDYAGTTLIDLTGDDVTAGDVLSGKKFHLSSGAEATGTMPTKSSSDLTASGATVSVPAGYYPTNASKSVASGSAGTPTATKGTVSNNQVTVTPKVTNTTGYITGGTKNGTAVTVKASDLVSGTKTISGSGSTDVTNYASASVAAGSATPPASISGSSATVTTGTNTLTLTKKVSVTPTVSAGYIASGTAGDSTVSLTASVAINDSDDITASGATVSVPAGYYPDGASKSVSSGTAGTPTASKGTVTDHSVSVTPSVTNAAGYISGGTKSGTAVTVSASELVSGTKTITGSGETDVTNYEKASVAAGSATAPSSISGSSATVSTGTNTLTLTKTVSITPSVSAGYVSSGTAGNSSVSLTASVTTKAAATLYPSSSDQTISSGQYLTGAQTIRGVTVSNLTAANIKSGVTVKVGDAGSAGRIASVTGTYTGKTKDNFGIESYVPSNLSEGTDGLIFLRTGYIKVADGQYVASTNKKFYMTQSGADGAYSYIAIDSRPLYVVCGLDWIVWWGWTYSSTTYASATRALTGSGYSGAKAIRVPYSSTDKRLCLSFRKSDSSVFTDAELTALKNSIKFTRVVDL